MFEDQTNNQNIPPSNLPTEPVDIFADVEKNSVGSIPAEQPPNALSAGLLKKKEDLPLSPPLASATPEIPEMNAESINPAPMYAMKEPALGKIILFVVLAIILGGLGFGGWWVYSNYFNKSKVNTVEVVETPITTPDTANAINAIVTETPATIPTDVELNRDINNDKILFGEPIDSDKDGLDDVREKEIGTDPSISDTDGDGLIDGDEVIIWKTNPMMADTDGDGHVDGAEVYNGYNPLGPGKLFVPSKTSTSTDVSTSTDKDVNKE